MTDTHLLQTSDLKSCETMGEGAVAEVEKRS